MRRCHGGRNERVQSGAWYASLGGIQGIRNVGLRTYGETWSGLNETTKREFENWLRLVVMVAND
jgi:hypothetical protein